MRNHMLRIIRARVAISLVPWPSFLTANGLGTRLVSDVPFDQGNLQSSN